MIDTSRIASGPPSIWADVLLTNTKYATKSIDKLTGELEKLKTAIKNENKRQVERMLETARNKRAALIKYKMRKKELVS